MALCRIVLLAAAFTGVALMPARQPASKETGDMSTALQRTQALQDGARVLRNGARVGAGAQVLAREAARLRADLDVLIESHHRWAEALPDSRQSAVKTQLAVVDEGCARMRTGLGDLDRMLRTGTVDREVVQSVGQLIGRQARLCARALHRAQAS